MIIQDQAESVINCFAERVIQLRWWPETPELQIERQEFKANIYQKLEPIERLIKKNGNKWICGEKLTWVDFFLAMAISVARVLNPDAAAELTAINAHLDRLRENAGFKKYYDSIPTFDGSPLRWDIPISVLLRDPSTGEPVRPKFL